VAIVCIALSVYWFILIARVIVSLVQAFGNLPDALHPVARVLYDLTEPVLAPVRNLIPPVGMFDLSVIIVFLILGAVQGVLCGV
jgi:YggT family protein